MRTLLIDFMGQGFLDNIIALMKQDKDAVRFLPDLVGNDQIVVRLGATALIEELVREQRGLLGPAVPGLVRLLEHENATIRGDAANALGLIGDRTALPALRQLLDDRQEAVREVVREAMEEIGRRGG